MISTGLIILMIFCLTVYLYYLFLFRRGLKKQQNLYSFLKPKVSVIIAARNEEENIPFLLTGLVNQSYPENLIEIIIADDGSEDQTARIIQEFGQRWQNIKYLRVIDREQVRSPKKNALSQAIMISEGELILTTDADCRVGPGWIESHVNIFTENVDFVAGFSRTRLNWQKAGLAARFEHFDFLSMFVAAAGAISAGRYFSCSGQNLAFRKSAYDQVGGYEEIKQIVSGDDVNLLQLMRKNGFKAVFNYQPLSFTSTASCSGWFSLINQRSRWASNMKWQLKLNPEFFFYLISVPGTVYLPIVLLFFRPWLAAVLIVTRVIAELNLLMIGSRKFKEEKKILNFYPLWFILQPVYILIVALFGAFDFFRWKE